MFWHGASCPGMDSWYASTPTARTSVWHRGAWWRAEPAPGKGHSLQWAHQVAEYPWHAPDGTCLVTSLPRAIPTALLCQAFLSSRLCHKPKEGGAGIGHHYGCGLKDGGGRGSPLHIPRLAMTLPCSAKCRATDLAEE